MSQFMENRAKYLIICIVILSFIGITEFAMAHDDSHTVILLTDEEKQEIVTNNQERIDAIDEQLLILFQQRLQGAITEDEYNAQVEPLANEKERLWNEISNSVFGGLLATDNDDSMNLGGMIIGFFTIEIPDAPAFITLLLSVLNSVLLAISIIITASYIYDGIKALPFT